MLYSIEDEKMKKAWKDNNMLLREGKTSGNTHYKFIKDGKTYYAMGDNLIDACNSIEISEGISLKGASYEEIYKLRTVRKGVVR